MTGRARPHLLARVTKLNAQERGDDPAADLKRTVLRIVRDGPAPNNRAHALSHDQEARRFFPNKRISADLLMP